MLKNKNFRSAIIFGLILTLLSLLGRGIINPPEFAKYEYKQPKPETSQYPGYPHPEVIDGCIGDTLSRGPQLYKRGLPVSYVSVYRYEASCASESDELEITFYFLAFIFDLAVWSIIAFLVMHFLNKYKRRESASTTPASNKVLVTQPKSPRLLCALILLVGGVISFAVLALSIWALMYLVGGEFQLMPAMLMIILGALGYWLVEKLRKQLTPLNPMLSKKAIKFVLAPFIIMVPIEILLFLISLSSTSRSGGHDSLGFYLLSGVAYVVTLIAWFLLALGLVATANSSKK